MRISFADGVFEQLRQHAFAGSGIVDAVGHAKLDVVHTDLQGIAGISALDIDRPGENMHAGALGAFHLGVNTLRIGEHFIARNSVTGEKLLGIFIGGQPLVRQRFDLDDLPRFDRQRRL